MWPSEAARISRRGWATISTFQAIPGHRQGSTRRVRSPHRVPWALGLGYAECSGAVIFMPRNLQVGSMTGKDVTPVSPMVMPVALVVMPVAFVVVMMSTMVRGPGAGRRGAG